jgi:hypothetical protein
METPRTEAGRLTDRIMMAIHDHIKGCGVTVSPASEPTPTHHYNKAWSKVLEILERELK